MKRLRYVGGYRKPNQISGYEKRIKTLIAIALLIFTAIIVRLFQVQVIQHKAYSQTAKAQHFGSIKLPAKRGEIFVRDRNSNQLSKLATNTTLNLLYVDPNVVYIDPDTRLEKKLTLTDFRNIAEQLAPLIFTKADYETCLKNPRYCSQTVEEKGNGSLSNLVPYSPSPSSEELENEDPVEERIQNQGPSIAPVFKPYSTVIQEIVEDTVKKISRMEMDFVVLKRDAEDELIEAIERKNLPGIFFQKEGFLIYANPTLIPSNRLNFVAEQLSPLLERDKDALKRELSRRDLRYVFLKNRLSPEISEKIRALRLRGVVLIPEHWRYYPEDHLASHAIGFINHENLGQYGIEGYFNQQLEGKSGSIYAESDPFGRQINMEEATITNAIHGSDLVLTLDRIVQKRVEEILSEAVEKYQADSGQVIIMNPNTGAIISMATFPNFNPNHYASALTLRRVGRGEQLFRTTTVFKKDERGKYINALAEEREDESLERFVYENRLGPGAFRNPVVSDLYEPGSVFKPIIMAIALDTQEIVRQTTFNDTGPKRIDGFEIRNSVGQYKGVRTMTEVLEDSLNTGMIFVAQKLGPKLMHDYLKKFGFGQYTNLTVDGETQGKMVYYKEWSKTQLFTTSFGQGIVATPLQVITAWATLANGGKLIQPYIVESVIKGEEVTRTEPQVIRRILSEETSTIITSMLMSVVRKGHGTGADIPGHLVAGKTGTSQIASSTRAGYETGPGSVVTSFVGYFPAYDPQFVILVKFDRPRLNINAWGTNTAVPTFRQIADFLIEHYNLQPS